MSSDMNRRAFVTTAAGIVLAAGPATRLAAAESTNKDKKPKGEKEEKEVGAVSMDFLLTNNHRRD